ncbi:MAG: aspartate--tRNA ligase [Planctomycetota bacterium]|nr:aspartate--tRNA ligase [Planctomycetota bacterium]
METTYRSHTCGALRLSDEGATVHLCGWVGSMRDQGGVLFVDLRDRYGLTQCTFRGDLDADLLAAAEKVRGEWTLRVTGKVIPRPDEARNPNLPTGDIEVEATALQVLSESKTPPFPLDERADVSPEVRLRHRYLDLRRARMGEILRDRARIASIIRRGFDEQGFLDVETPTLVRSTPEGARDYLVPSRVHPGQFYALPQSPQIFKQLLMVGGQDRYYQFARCYRDEDLRADRQPEFTQIDVEATFVRPEDVWGFFEPVIAELVQEFHGREVPPPFRRMPYHECMERFGSDKPDLRNPLELHTVSAEASRLGFRVFSSVVEDGGMVKALVGPGAASFSRKEIDGLEAEAKSMGAAGLAWAKITEDGATGPISKFLGGDEGAAFIAAVGAKPGDLLMCAAGGHVVVNRVLSALRDRVAGKLDLIDRSRTEVLWVTDFPLLEWNEESERFMAQHHPFTMPVEEDLPLVFEAAAAGPDGWDRAKLESIRTQAYDLVIDGVEMGSGSVRIHRQDVQQAAFALLGISEEDIEQRFGWFVDALQYGTPPHGGFAIGFDRLVMTLLGEDGIQDVIAFPKTMTAVDLMCRAPAPVDEAQLGELHIGLTVDPEEASDEDEAGAGERSS